MLVLFISEKRWIESLMVNLNLMEKGKGFTQNTIRKDQLLDQFNGVVPDEKNIKTS